MTLVYNGIQYEVEEECDADLANADNADETRTTADGVSESAWEPKNVHLFLDECIKRKHALHDPKIRRRKIFSDIRDRMRTKGYIFRTDSLDRKLRNLKIHYLVTRDNNKNLQRRVHWPYYDKMKAIYPEASRKRTRARSPSPPPPESDSQQAVSPPLSPASSLTMFKIQKLSETPKSAPDNFPEEEEHDQPINIEPVTNLESLRRQILAFEERRTVAAEKILKELKESNRLKRELLDLSIKRFKAESERDYDEE